MTLQTSAVGPAIHRKFALSGGQAAHRKGAASHTLADRLKKRSTRGSRYPGAKPRTGKGAPLTRLEMQEVCHEFNGHAGHTSSKTEGHERVKFY